MSQLPYTIWCSCPELLNVDLRKSKIMNRFALAANPEQNHCIRAYDGCYVPREDCLVVLVQSTTTYIVKVPLLKDRFQQVLHSMRLPVPPSPRPRLMPPPAPMISGNQFGLHCGMYFMMGGSALMLFL